MNSHYSYGGKGYEIMLFMLLHMFPDLSFDMSPIKPLSYKAFIAEVLLPEVCVRLIQQDLQVNQQAAQDILIQSQRFGNLQYPGGHTDPDVQYITNKATFLMKRNQDLLTAYEVSDTTMDFSSWVKTQQQSACTKLSQQVVKAEEVDMQLGLGEYHAEMKFDEIVKDGRTVMVLLD